MKKILFRGSATALVTPFCEDDSVNLEVLSQLVEYQIKSGTQALVILGTTGESPTVSYEERKEIISKVSRNWFKFYENCVESFKRSRIFRSGWAFDSHSFL